MIADWAPPLLLLGLTPAMVDALARRGGKTLAVLTRPKVALPVWLVGWYAIHFAGFYDAALRNPWLLNLEHAALIAIGLLFWWPVIAGKPNPLSTLASLGYLAAAFVGSAFLGPRAHVRRRRPVYAFYEDAPRLWGLSAVAGPELRGRAHERRAGARLPRSRSATSCCADRRGRRPSRASDSWTIAVQRSPRTRARRPRRCAGPRARRCRAGARRALAPAATASRATSGQDSARRKTSTRSTGSSIVGQRATPGSPRHLGPERAARG